MLWEINLMRISKSAGLMNQAPTQNKLNSYKSLYSKTKTTSTK